MAETSLRLRVLGPPEVTLRGAPAPPELLWRKHFALLVYLALSPRRTRTRDHLVGLLWGDKAETAARHSLREAIRVLRQHLGRDAIEATGQTVRLVLDHVELDASAFERCATRGAWNEAAEVVTGEFLEGFGVPGASAFEDWLTAQRSEWRGRIVRAQLEHAEQCLREGDLDAGRRIAARALAVDPLSDGVVRLAMRAEALAGDRAAALDVFATFGRRAKESGLTPSAETVALAERIGTRGGRVPRVPRPRQEAWTRRAPLVGRATALSGALAPWDAVQASATAAVVLIEGDLGLGKTRVLDEVLDRARLDGAAVARALAVRADVDDPDSGVIGLARGGLLDAPGVAAASPGALAALAGRVPSWAERFPSVAADAPPPLAAAFREIVLAGLEEAPMVLAVDEAHWLDPQSLRVLEALLRDARERPLFVLLTVMPSAAVPVIDDLRTTLGGALAGTTVRLGRLDAGALRELAAWALPRYEADALDRVARRVAADSAGIPLLAVELLHAITLGLEPGAGDTDAWPAPFRTLDQTLPADLPDSIVAAVRIGFRALSQTAQEVLAALAVLPERSAEETVAGALDLPLPDARGALDELEWQRWITADGRGYAFVARIVREIVARDMLTPGQRRRIEERAGT